jgi:hypothetical protein
LSDAACPLSTDQELRRAKSKRRAMGGRIHRRPALAVEESRIAGGWSIIGYEAPLWTLNGQFPYHRASSDLGGTAWRLLQPTRGMIWRGIEPFFLRWRQGSRRRW